MTRRKYKSGSRWALWRWSDVPSEFITRLHLVKTPWFAVALHWIHKPDPEPYLHDHPVSFLSLVLRGGYTEWRAGLSNPLVTHRWWNYVRANYYDRHSILGVEPNTVTLCFMGPKRREWGYHTEGGGWVHWKDYQAQQRRGERR